jgi:hypothetical protein
VSDRLTQTVMEQIVTISKARPQDALLYDMKLPLRQTFYPLGFAMEIVTNHPDVLIAAAESFGHITRAHTQTSLQIHVGISDGPDLPCPPEPVRREFNHLYSLVADVENQAMLELGTCTSFAWITRSALKHRLYFRYNFLEKMVYLLLGASVVTDIHAACITKLGKGLLLCGDSGAGKSTLAYACARAGWTYTSDDTSYLINQHDPPRVIGHSHRVRFRPASRELFPELRSFDITPRMEGKPSIEVLVSELPIANTENQANVNAVIYLMRYPSAKGRLVSLPKGSATLRMRDELFSAGDVRAKHEAILEVFFNIPTYELQYNTLEQAIEQLNYLVQRL